MKPDEHTLSRSVEDYLKAVYALTEGGDPASTSALADHLGVQPASVTGMVKRLAEDGWVEHAPYRGVRLTPSGRTQALRVIRRHRILETYLVERLGYTWDDVHAEAERLEHAASDDLIDRMAAHLEDPSHDPHGAPIPTRAGEIEPLALGTLAEAAAGERVEIRAVRDEDAAELRHLEAVGLVPGTTVTVVDVTGPDGGVTVDIGGEPGAASRERVRSALARRIYVRDVDA
ncbi:MAG: metal-dependent transcriptional regulator [Gemmatimonadetes bacterium]|nr:MAG: metal-dependent transcriptional regulator [Gemmatimonadota bacterium]